MIDSRDAAHNVLVFSSPDLPDAPRGRRTLGLPPAPSGCRPRLLARAENVPPGAARLLARILRRAGGAAHAPGHRVLLLSGDRGAFRTLLERAARRDDTAGIAAEIDAALGALALPPSRLRLRNGTLDLGATVVMGILNVTPDSFSDGGRFVRRAAARAHALRMAREGARILDVGGESTRPGAAPVPLPMELRRVLPIVETLAASLRDLGRDRPLLSIDTTKAEVARRAVEAGADLINDISGMSFDPAMPAVAAEAGVPVVLQHIRGTPRTMRHASRYRHLVPDLARFLRSRIAVARRAGVRDDRMVIDPGIGFGKNRADNLAILRHLPALRSLGKPILLGASRKSFIGGAPELPVGDRLEGSLAAEALAIAGGAAIIRAHDVRAAVRVARLCDAVVRDAPPHG